MSRRPYQTVAIWLLVSLVMTWPALLNGGAIWFHDSFAYFLVPEELVRSMTGLDLQPFGKAHYLSGAPMSGRSAWYGASVLFLQSWFGDTAIVAFQSALLSGAVLLATRTWIGEDRRALIAIGLAVAFFTPAPFFTSYVMPDYLAGLAGLAALQLLMQVAPVRVWERVFWWTLLGFAMLCHSSHVLLVAGLFLAVPLAQTLMRQRLNRPALAGIAGACAAVVALGQVQSSLLTARYGEAELQPPFLSARLIDDGPGYLYLAEHCPQAGYELCNHIERLPVASDWFLWDKRAETGVYQLATPQSRRRMGDEQFRFARAVLASYPWSQARASLGNVAEQMSRFSLREFAYNDEMRERTARMFAGERLGAHQATRLHDGRFPLVVVSALQQAALVVALLVAGFCLIRSSPTRLVQLGIGVALILIGNAAITGMLSTPHDRYQARVIWLAIWLAAVLWFDFAGRQTQRSAADARA